MRDYGGPVEVEFVLSPAAVARLRPLNRNDPREGVLDDDALSVIDGIGLHCGVGLRFD